MGDGYSNRGQAQNISQLSLDEPEFVKYACGVGRVEAVVPGCPECIGCFVDHSPQPSSGPPRSRVPIVGIEFLEDVDQISEVSHRLRDPCVMCPEAPSSFLRVVKYLWLSQVASPNGNDLCIL